jgi:iron-sulfur cluster assembly protein
MLSLTDRAAKKIQQVITKRGKGTGIRLGVKTTGCSGLAYVLEYVDTPVDGDVCVDCKDCKLFVDPKSCPYLQGMEVDYVRDGINEGFKFNNPNERDRCGCGSSFRV